jgi:spore coat protein CotH
MIRRLFILIVAGLLAACSALPSRGDALPALNGTWTISFTQSGGFIGMSKTITITSDGKVVAVDDREGQTVTLQLTPQELAALKEQVSNAGPKMPIKTDTGCADCFIYDLQIKTTGARFSVQLDDVTLPDSGLQSLIMYLQELMERALSA